MRDVHPGEVLKQELEEIGVAPTKLARQIDIPVNCISEIIAGKRSVTGDYAAGEERSGGGEAFQGADY